MDLGLSGANAVVTGGSKGMGRAIAERLAAEGARVAVLARGREALDETVDVLHRAGSKESLRGCRSTSPSRRRSRRPSPSWAGAGRSLNVLVNTLGPGAGRFEQLDDAGWEATFRSA